MGARTAGWYADPITVGAARYWDGRGWTQQVAWGGQIRTDPTPLADVRRRDERARAETVADYLADARQRHVVEPAAIAALLNDVERRTSLGGATPLVEPPIPATVRPPSAAGAPATATRTTAAGHATTRPPATDRTGPSTSQPSRPAAASTPRAPAISTSEPAPRPATASAPPSPETVAPIPSEPGRIARWWGDVQHAVRSDLALHGLAYLGVLLLFAGVTGLIVFSFGDVSPWLRPLAELLVPVALFVSAWYLHRRDAAIVAASLTFLGGAITPIVVAASLTDGFDVPPDLTGRALPIVQGIAVAVVAVVYGILTLRRPEHPLRHLAAPVLWMATGIAAGVWRDPVPLGYETARADSLQLAVILAAITATVAMCAWRAVPSALAVTTKRTALPVAAIVVVLESILAMNEGWPLASTIVVALSALVLIELSVERLTPAVASIAQVAVVVITAGRLAVVGEPRWIAVGAAVGLIGLVEYHGRRRPTLAGTVVGLAAAGVALLLVVADPAPSAVAFGVLTAWGLWRHVAPPEWLPFRDPAGFVPAVAAVVTTIALWDLGSRGPALVATAAAVLALAVVGRYWRSDDLLWRWFTPSAAGAVVVVSMTFPWGELAIEVAVATALVTAAILLCALPATLRVWATAGTVVWALANVAAELEIARGVQAIVLGGTALVLVVGAVIAARPVGVQLAWVGHLAGIGALVAATWPGRDAAVVVAMATIAWLVATVVDERGEAIHLAALRRVLALGTIETGDAGDAHGTGDDGATSELVVDPTYGAADAIPIVEQLPPLVTLTGSVASVVLAVEAAGWMAVDDPWVGVIIAGLAVLAAAVVRVAPWRRARPRFLAWVTLVLATVAAVAVIAAAGSDRESWAPVAAVALGLTVVAVTAPPRPLAFVWIAWFDGGALVLFVADRLGLDRDWTDVAAAGWGAAALLGGLAVYRRRHGPVVSTDLEDEPLLWPPLVLGLAAFVIGGVLGLSDGSDVEIGWTATGLALVVLAAALLIPLGALVALAEALTTVAIALLAPWEPLDRPWTLAPWAVVLLTIALVTRRVEGWDLRRWDLPSFLVAHGVALVALTRAIGTDTIVPTYALFGALSMAVAVVLRRWPWAASGAALVLVAAFDAGHGWLALVLVAVGIVLTVAGLLRANELRWMLLGLGATAFVGAWFDVAEWLQWSSGTMFLATMPSAAALALGAAIALRTRAVPRELAAVWTIAGSSLAVGMTGLVESAGRSSGGLAMAGSLLLLAAAAGVLAAVLTGLLRWVTALFVAAAWLAVRWALQPTDRVVVLVGTCTALASLVALVALHRRRPGAVWLLPASGHAAFLQLGAVVAASAALPDAGLMVVVLVAIAVELTVLGWLQTGEPRWILLGVGAAALVGAWFEFADWQEWSGQTVFVATTPAAAFAALLAAAGLRSRLVPLEPAGVYVVAGSLVAIGTTTLVDEVARRPGGLAMAGALLLLAATAATLAAVVSGWLRWVAAVLAAGALVPLHWALEPTDALTTLVGTGLALAVLVAALAVHGRRPDAVWLLPGSVYGAAVQCGAAVAAVAALPETSSFVVVLLAIGAELVAFGVLTGLPELFVLAPAAACAAWLVYAQDALRGNANWFTVPIGVTVLVMVGLLRWIRSWRGGEVTGFDVVALELVGMSFLVASPLARTLAGHLWNGVLAIVIGVLVAGWGTATRVRWRVGFGAGSVVLAVVLLIGVPLSDAVTWRGPMLWIVLSLVGIGAIVAASALESSRDRLMQLAHRLDEMTEGWERIPLHHDDTRDDHRPLPPPPVTSGGPGEMGSGR